MRHASLHWLRLPASRPADLLALSLAAAAWPAHAGVNFWTPLGPDARADRADRGRRPRLPPFSMP